MEKGKHLESTCQSPIGTKRNHLGPRHMCGTLNVTLRHTPNSPTPVDHTVTCEASNPAQLKLITNLIRNHHAIISFR
jgi:hypothetical protein